MLEIKESLGISVDVGIKGGIFLGKRGIFLRIRKIPRRPTKARMVAGGNTQRDYLTKEDSSSPTVSTEAVLLTSIIDAHEGRDVTVIDIPNAFIQTRVDSPKDRVIIRMRGVVVDWLVKTAPECWVEITRHE